MLNDAQPVVIGIPTFRRPELLRRLLRSLRPELTGQVSLVVVADNAADPGTAEIVAEELNGLAAHCVVAVPEPGISPVRDALIRTAYAEVPNWRWLVMLDDDGEVLPEWLAPLLATAERFEADVAAGPVLGDLPQDASRLARNSFFAGRARHQTGLVPVLNGAQNIMLSRGLIDRLDEPWFRPDLGRSGGEDYEFFCRANAVGARLVWCDEACVVEPTPADRLGTKALLTRAYRANVVNARTDVRYQGRRPVARTLGRYVGYLGRGVAAGVIRRDPDRLLRSSIEAVSVAGRAVGLARTGRRTTH